MSKKFDRNELPFNQAMNNFWETNGYLVINNFYTISECDNLRNRADYLIKNFVGLNFPFQSL